MLEKLVLTGRRLNPEIEHTVDALHARGAVQRHTASDERSGRVLPRLARRGLPNVLGEATACATPAVASSVGDAPEILGDPRLLAPMRDSYALSVCIRRVLEVTDEERRALGLSQRRRMELRFDTEQIWTEYLALYVSLSA